MSARTLRMLMVGAVLGLCAGWAVGQDAPNLPTPPQGEIWVYPQGVFPDDFYSLWLAVNGAPYTAGDLPYPFYSVPDSEPDARPVFIGEPDSSRNWTVVLKARRLEKADDNSYVEGALDCIQPWISCGNADHRQGPVLPVGYLLTTGEGAFSTGFGEILVCRPVAITGEVLPDGEERFFGYTPNFDPATSPDTNPTFTAGWLPASYPRGSEYESGQGYGVRSAKSVVYGGYLAFHLFYYSVDLSVSDWLLYGQYGTGIRINNPPSQTLISNVDIKHTYHCHMLGDKKNWMGMFTWAIDIEAIRGAGGQHLIEDCLIDQSPTWQEYYFAAYPIQRRYYVEWFPGGHGVFIYNLAKVRPDDRVQIKNRRSRTAEATASSTTCPTPTSASRSA